MEVNYHYLNMVIQLGNFKNLFKLIKLKLDNFKNLFKLIKLTRNQKI